MHFSSYAFFLLATVFTCGCATSVAEPLFDVSLEVTKVSDSVYTAVGATQAPSYENWGHNNNLSFVIGEKAVLVVNGGDNYALARALHNEIRKLTDLPVAWVTNENGQGHAFLGNSYWRQQGVTIIAHRDAREEIQRHGADILRRMLERNKERGRDTAVVTPDKTFTEFHVIDLGGLLVELRWFGHAHSPGDISVWIPQQAILIAGDIAFHERLLGIFPDTNVRAWLRSFEVMAELAPQLVIPGHGHPTQMSEIKTYTYDYLKFLVREVSEILDRDGDLSEAYEIDQSAYAHLDTFDELAVKNAGRVYQALELELFE